MEIRSISLIVAVCLSIGLLGQAGPVDTADIRRIHEQAAVLMKTDADSALIIVQAAIPIAERLVYRTGLFELWQTMGRIYNTHYQQDSAIVVFERAEAIARQMQDQRKICSVLIDLGKAYNSINQKREALDYLQEAVQIATDMGDIELQYQALRQTGLVHSYLTEYDQAEAYLLQAVALAQELGDLSRQARMYQNLGNNAARSRDLDRALAYYDQARALVAKTDDRHLESIILRMMGYSCLVLGDAPRSLEYYQTALTMLEKLVDKEDLGRCLEELGKVYLAMEDYESALHYYERAQLVWEAIGTASQRPQVMIEKGRILYYQGKYDLALKSLRKSLDMKAEAGQKILETDLYLLSGLSYEQLHILDSAEFFLELALDLSTQANDFQVKSQSLAGLGKVYRQLGRIEPAERHLQQALAAAYQSGNKQHEMEAAAELYQIHKERNNADRALYYHEIYWNLHDSLLNEKNVRQFTRLQSRIEFDKEKHQMEIEREREQASQRSQRRLMLFALAGALGFILIVVRYYRSKQKANTKLSALNAELRQQKAVVEKQNEALAELDEMKTRFFTNISHEFRTPLTVIGGMVQQIEKTPNEHLEKRLNLIRRNTDNLLNLVNQIMDLRKLESGHLKLELVQGDVVKYIRYITESFHSMAESKNIKLHFLSDHKSVTMDYDEEKLLRIISNLLSNAIKFTPEGGDVYLQISNGEGLRIRVMDNGIGIPPEKLPHIFDRFYQADDSSIRPGEGTGIGLALTRELVKLMKGTVEVQSEVDRGTTFVVTLPIQRQAPLVEDHPVMLHPAPASVGTSAPAPAPVDKDLPALLIIEDNPDVVEYLRSFLSMEYRVAVATDGQQGIEAAVDLIPDLIISDVMMPVKDGYEVCEFLKNDERTSHIPIVLLTARADKDSRIAGLKRGADAYLAKPFNQEELLVRLRKLMELRDRLQQRYAALQPGPPSTDIGIQQEDAFIVKLRSAVMERLDDENFGIPELCKAAGMSRSQLHLKIKALTGRSTSHFMRGIRLQQAKELLSTAELNVTEVAYEVGFKDPNYFSRCFSEEFGLSPKKFLDTHSS